MNLSPNTPLTAVQGSADVLPARALNLARRALEIERRHGGRAQVTLVLTMIDGVWALVVARPSELERLGE